MSGHQCHPLLGKYVEVVDVKRRLMLDVVGRRGVIHHDDTFGHDYLSFEDGGSADPVTEVIVERIITDEEIERCVASSPSPTGTRAYLNALRNPTDGRKRPPEGGDA